MARSSSVAPALFVALLGGATAAVVGCASIGARTDSSSRVLGWRSALGNGTVSSYAELDATSRPAAIGVVLSPTALDGLPTGSDRHHCFDRKKDGVIECHGTFEFAIPLPDAVSRRSDIPFKWVLFNWNPGGHPPPGVWDIPHFDIHFYKEPIADVFAIHSGPCGPEFVRCDQFETGRKPIPSNYTHPDFKDVGAVVPGMGNHLLDLTAPEFNKQPFTRSWIFGAYDGRITFYEEMVTRAFLLSKTNICFPIKSPKAVAVTGFYPTESCIRYNATTGEHSVSIEKFILREGSAAAPSAAKMGSRSQRRHRQELGDDGDERTSERADRPQPGVPLYAEAVASDVSDSLKRGRVRASLKEAP